MVSMKAVFLDRDGTINTEYEDGGLDDITKTELIPGGFEAFERLAKLNYKLFIVTNQNCVAEGRISDQEFHAINDKIVDLIKPSGAVITRTYYCAHDPSDGCDCKKPKPGMLQQAAEEFDINLAESYMIGDRDTDVLTGINAGTKTIKLSGGLFGQLDNVNPDFEARNLLEAIKYIEGKAA